MKNAEMPKDPKVISALGLWERVGGESPLEKRAKRKKIDIKTRNYILQGALGIFLIAGGFYAAYKIVDAGGPLINHYIDKLSEYYK